MKSFCVSTSQSTKSSESMLLLFLFDFAWLNPFQRGMSLSQTLWWKQARHRLRAEIEDLFDLAPHHRVGHLSQKSKGQGICHPIPYASSAVTQLKPVLMVPQCVGTFDLAIDKSGQRIPLADLRRRRFDRANFKPRRSKDRQIFRPREKEKYLIDRREQPLLALQPIGRHVLCRDDLRRDHRC